MQKNDKLFKTREHNAVFKAASSLVHNELLNEIYVNGTSGRKQYLLGCPSANNRTCVVSKDTATTYISLDRL